MLVGDAFERVVHQFYARCGQVAVGMEGAEVGAECGVGPASLERYADAAFIRGRLYGYEVEPVGVALVGLVAQHFVDSHGGM